MAKKDKLKTKNKVINMIYYIEFIMLTILVFAYIGNYVFFSNWQRIKVQYYLETDRIKELTVEECKEVFGEPIYVTNMGNILFEGGSKCSGGFLFRYYEYVLYVEPMEDGIGVERAYTKCVYERIY